MSSNLDGTDVRALDMPVGSSVSAIGSLAVHAGMVFFASDGGAPAINRVRVDGTDFKVLRRNTANIAALRMFVSQRDNGEPVSELLITFFVCCLNSIILITLFRNVYISPIADYLCYLTLLLNCLSFL